MIVIGILLLLLGAGVGAFAWFGLADETGRIMVSALGLSFEASPFQLVVLGALGMALLALGWAALAARARRAARERRERQHATALAEERDKSAAQRTQLEQQFEQAQLRDEDFSRRERELSARADGLEGREHELNLRDRELSRRETEWRDRMPPSRADVLAGRAVGNVADGTARWVDQPEGAPAASDVGATQTLPTTEGTQR